jgi:hypothetical protein
MVLWRFQVSNATPGLKIKRFVETLFFFLKKDFVLKEWEFLAPTFFSSKALLVR